MNNFSAQKHVVLKQAHFIFQSYGGEKHKTNVLVETDILILGLLAFLEVKVLGKVFF